MKTYRLTNEELESLLDASKPVPYMIFGGQPPPSAREHAVRLWRHVADRVGCKLDTITSAGTGDMHDFSAEPADVPPPKPGPTKAEKNRLLATAAGWQNRLATLESPVERCGMRLPNSFGHPIEAWWHETNEEHRGVYAMPPDFFDTVTGLHHCARLRAVLSREQRGDFISWLNVSLNDRNRADPKWLGPTPFDLVNADAPTQAEALLITLKLLP